MASAIIHYVIANSLLNRIDVNNKNHFLIGSSLGPDASSHEDGSYDIAHFWSFSQEGTRKGIHWKHFAERYQEQILANDFVLGYYCHLIQDAVWFHDIVDTNIRCYVGDEKKQAYRRGYRDYERLNYLLVKEYLLHSIMVEEVKNPIEEIDCERLAIGVNNFDQWFCADSCTKEDLDIYKWDDIIEYIDKCVNLCVSEIGILSIGKIGVAPETYFVKV